MAATRGWRCASSRSRCVASRPTISTSGRSTRCRSRTSRPRYFARGGAIEALRKAKEQGKVRYVGFTGHKDPSLHLEMLSHGFPFDAVQMPLNCFDGQFRSFERRVLPEVIRQGIAPIGMKSLGGDARSVTSRTVRPADAISYSLSLPIATLVSGIDSMKVLDQNVAIAAGFTAARAARDAGAAAEGRRTRRGRTVRALQDRHHVRRTRVATAAWAANGGGSAELIVGCRLPDCG